MTKIGTERAFFVDPNDTHRFCLKIQGRFPEICRAFSDPKGRNMLTEVDEENGHEHCHYALMCRGFPEGGIHVFELLETFKLNDHTWEYVWQLKTSTSKRKNASTSR